MSNDRKTKTPIEIIKTKLWKRGDCFVVSALHPLLAHILCGRRRLSFRITVLTKLGAAERHTALAQSA